MICLRLHSQSRVGFESRSDPDPVATQDQERLWESALRLPCESVPLPLLGAQRAVRVSVRRSWPRAPCPVLSEVLARTELRLVLAGVAAALRTLLPQPVAPGSGLPAAGSVF